MSAAWQTPCNGPATLAASWYHPRGGVHRQRQDHWLGPREPPPNNSMEPLRFAPPSTPFALYALPSTLFRAPEGVPEGVRAGDLRPIPARRVLRLARYLPWLPGRLSSRPRHPSASSGLPDT